MKKPKLVTYKAYAIIGKDQVINIFSYPIKDYKLTAWAIVTTLKEAKILMKKATTKYKNKRIVEVQINYID